MTDKPPSKGERAVFWVGSLAGIATSLFTLYDRVFGPSPPQLAVSFDESRSTDLRITPSGDMSSGFTEAIPLKLRIENTGGKASANTKLYITYRTTTQISTQGSEDALPILSEKNENLQQRSITVENLNPGEVYLLPITVRFMISREQKDALHAPPDSAAAKKLPYGYTIFTDVSSDTAPNQRTDLNVLLGRCGALAERGAVFWMGHNENQEGVTLIRVREDFPCDG